MTGGEAFWIVLYGLVAAWHIAFSFGVLDGVRLRADPVPPFEQATIYGFKGGFGD